MKRKMFIIIMQMMLMLMRVNKISISGLARRAGEFLKRTRLYRFYSTFPIYFLAEALFGFPSLKITKIEISRSFSFPNNSFVLPSPFFYDSFEWRKEKEGKLHRFPFLNFCMIKRITTSTRLAPYKRIIINMKNVLR